MGTDSLQSEIFMMSRKEFARHLFLLYGPGWLAGVLLLGLPALAAGIFVDLRWLMVFFMIVCLLIPMLTAFLYFYHGMRPLTVANIVPHRLIIAGDTLTVVIYDTEVNESGEKIYTYRSERRFHFARFQRYITGYASVILPLKSTERGFLWLPLSAFRDKEDFSQALQAISDGISASTRN